MSGPIAAVSTTISAMNERRPPRRPDRQVHNHDSPSEQPPDPDRSGQPVARPSPPDEAPAATLFSTSLIAGRMVLSAPPQSRAKGPLEWAPPESQLRLRDKTI